MLTVLKLVTVVLTGTVLGPTYAMPELGLRLYSDMTTQRKAHQVLAEQISRWSYNFAEENYLQIKLTLSPMYHFF